LLAGFATADFLAAGFAFAAGFDLALGEDFAADFFDEALAMASRRCMSETAAALHHGCTSTRKRRPADIRVFDHEQLQIVTEMTEMPSIAASPVII
jgi:hypothetical protein